MQQDDERRPPLSRETAVYALRNWCEMNGVEASEWLVQIFAEAGGLAAERAPHRSLLSTRLLLLATAQLGNRIDAHDREARVIRCVGKLLHRDSAKLQALLAAYFAPRKPNQPTSPPILTPNAERLLWSAGEAEEGVGRPSLLTATNFLLAYPLAGSKADEMLQRLGISSDDYQSALREAIAAPPELSASPPSGEHRQLNDRVSTHADEPATLDELGRAAFADILADRIREARQSGQTAEPSAFIVHLHGPWGSGKSSVLNFLEDNLSRGASPWIVVRFNAWRDQRLQPPWWRLITTIYFGARSKLGWRAPWLWLRWLIWRVRADYIPLLSVLAVSAIATFLLWRAGWLTQAKPADDGAKWMDAIKWIAPLAITLLTAIYVNSRSLALGSRRAAQTYADLKDDPFKPITKLFNQLVGAIRRPVAVFIDDLDRCDHKYVVDLLEGIQTLMRGTAVTYVVAADRKWICSSFEQRYAGFSPPIGESGRPLGYLFLDKLFQVSAAIPQIPRDVQSTYWARLLSPVAPDEKVDAEARLQAEAEATRDAAGLSRQEDLQALVQKAAVSGDRLRIQAVRAACAKRISSPDAVIKTEHRLEAFAHLLEPNPRAMKRLVNAYAMHQATLLLAGRETGAGPLARWTILELRWPLLADFLAVRSECVDALRRRLQDDELPQIPTSLRCLFGDELIVDVIGAEKDSDRLTTEVVRTVLGAVQGDR